MTGDRREDVAPVEAARDDRPASGRGSRAPAPRRCRRAPRQPAISRPLSGPMRTSPRPVSSAIGNRSVPDARDRRRRRGSRPACAAARRRGSGAVTDRVARDLVADVDDVRVRADPEHHPAADGRRRRPEVGGEGDDGSCHAPDGTQAPPAARTCRSGAGRRLGAASSLPELQGERLGRGPMSQ